MFVANFAHKSSAVEERTLLRSFGVVIEVPEETHELEIVDVYGEVATQQIRKEVQVAFPEHVVRVLGAAMMARCIAWDHQDEQAMEFGRRHVFNSQRESGTWDLFCTTCRNLLGENMALMDSQELSLQHVETMHEGCPYVVLD